MTAESELIRRAVGGEPEAFERLAAVHRPVALRVARSMLGEDDAAEDVAQEALIRLTSALPGFRGDAELKTWMYRVTLNLCHDHLRKYRRMNREVEVDSPTATGDAAFVSTPDPEGEIEADRRRAALQAAIDRLPEPQRVAVTLRYLSDLPYEEIARVTDTPLGTVASRVFRALKRLGDDLEPRHLEMLK